MNERTVEIRKMNRSMMESQLYTTFITLCQKGNGMALEQWVTERHIPLKDLVQRFNKEGKETGKDWLIEAIEQNLPFKVMEAVLSTGAYPTLNYTFSGGKKPQSYYETWQGTLTGFYLSPSSSISFTDRDRIPLFEAIFYQHFPIADLLIQYNANLNYFTRMENVVDYLVNRKGLNLPTLHYILKRGVRPEYFTIHLPTFITQYQNDLLTALFHHYIFDRDFIVQVLMRVRGTNSQPPPPQNQPQLQPPQPQQPSLQLLSQPQQQPQSQNQPHYPSSSLTFQQLRTWIQREKNKLYIPPMAYQKAVACENVEALQLLLMHDGRDLDDLWDVLPSSQLLELASSPKGEALRRQLCNFPTIYL